MTKEAMKLALEAITQYLAESPDPSEEAVEGLCDARAILRKALANEALDKMAENARELGLDYEPAQQEPVALKWQQAPVKTQWGDDMVVASVAIDNDHTLSLYCERDQAPKVDVMFAQRTWVGLTDDEIHDTEGYEETREMYRFARAILAKSKEKNT